MVEEEALAQAEQVEPEVNPDAELEFVSLDDLDLDLDSVQSIEGSTAIDEGETSFSIKPGQYVYQLIQAKPNTVRGITTTDAEGRTVLAKLASGAITVKIVGDVQNKEIIERAFNQTFYLISKKGKPIQSNATALRIFAAKHIAAANGITITDAHKALETNRYSDFDLLYKVLPSTEEEPDYYVGMIRIDEAGTDYEKNVLNLRADILPGADALEVIQQQRAIEEAEAVS